MPSYECITAEYQQHKAVITLNRPKVLNALNNQLIDELLDAVRKVPADTRVLVLRGTGDQAFAAGADLDEMQKRTMWTDLNFGPRREVAHLLESAPYITLAAIKGYALGGGIELALACHLRAASTNAVLGLPETRLGLLPGNGGTARLTRLVGPGRAMRMILLGEHVPAAQAEQLGLVNWVFEHDEFDASLDALVEKLTRLAPVSSRAVIDCVGRAPDMTLDQAVENEHRWFQICLQTKDKQEGVAAFLEKRRPNFGQDN